MSSPVIFIFATGIIMLAVLTLLIILAAKGQKEIKLSPWTSLAFGFASTGTLFASDRILSYSLLGIGIIISVIEFYRLKKR